MKIQNTGTKDKFKGFNFATLKFVTTGSEGNLEKHEVTYSVQNKIRT